MQTPLWVKTTVVAVHGSSKSSDRIFSGVPDAEQAAINTPAVCVRKHGARTIEWLTCKAWDHRMLHDGVLDNGGLNKAVMLIKKEAWDEAHSSKSPGTGEEQSPRTMRSLPIQFRVQTVSVPNKGRIGRAF